MHSYNQICDPTTTEIVALVLIPGLGRVVSWGHTDCKPDLHPIIGNHGCHQSRGHWLHSRMPCRFPCRFPPNQWKRPRKGEEARQGWWPTAGNELRKNYRQHRPMTMTSLGLICQVIRSDLHLFIVYTYSYITCFLVFRLLRK